MGIGQKNVYLRREQNTQQKWNSKEMRQELILWQQKING